MDLALCSAYPLAHPFTSAEIKGVKKDKFELSPLTSCMVHREMEVLKESLVPFSILAILECAHLVLFEQQANTRHVQLHTQTQLMGAAETQR